MLNRPLTVTEESHHARRAIPNRFDLAAPASCARLPSSMTVYRKTSGNFEKVPETTFADENLLERQDLQRLLKSDISVLGDDLMVIAEEFGDWEEGHRRIDLLCLDDEGSLVVVELTRNADGGHMELQALRYAAMVSSMTLEQLLDAHARFLGPGGNRDSAGSAIRNFLGVDANAGVELRNVRIILVSANFSKEITTSVLWLNKHDLDIRCIRMQPYRLDNDVLIDVQQIVPLPEAEDYEVRIRAQEQESRRSESALVARRRRFWTQLIERSKAKTQIVAGRRPASDNWLAGGVGRAGFHLNFVVLNDDCRVECYIDFGKDHEERNLAALKMLRGERQSIEGAYGSPLDWQELEDARACRICHVMPGGWRTPEHDWPVLQDQLINAMVRLETALRGPILGMDLPAS
jgi:hypothetical protein